MISTCHGGSIINIHIYIYYLLNKQDVHALRPYIKMLSNKNKNFINFEF